MVGKFLSTNSFLNKLIFGIIFNVFSARTHPCLNEKELIKSTINESDILSEAGTELAFRLPLTASQQFPALLTEIDNNKVQHHYLQSNFD